MNNYLLLFFIFFIYSSIGWFMETIYVSIKKNSLSNRGFLIGPYCPIYGVSSILMINILSKYKSDILILFISGVFISSTLEYFTSYLLEKLFKVRWWDYSNYFLNIDGRVCLLNSIIFGVLCTILVIYINPYIINIIYDIPKKIINIISYILIVLFIVDTSFSFFTIYNIKKVLLINIKKDSTEDISKIINNKLYNSSKSFKRIITAFPNFIFIKK